MTGEWIKVEDRKPELPYGVDHVWVMVVQKHDRRPEVSIYDRQGFYHPYLDIKHVTHWQELPDPPERKEQ